MRDGWSIRLLGPVAVFRDGQSVAVGGPTARAVLAALALHGSVGASTGELLGTVWGGPDGVDRGTAHYYIRKLRAAFVDPDGPQVINAANHRYQLMIAEEAVDWNRFQRLLNRAEAQRATGVDEAVNLLEEAVGLWHGDALGDIGERMEADRRRMEGQRFVAVAELAAIEAARHRPRRVHDLLAPEWARGVLPEPQVILFLRALAALGRHEEVSDVYRRTYRYLREELGLDPTPRLLAVYRDLLTTGPDPVPVAVAQTAALEPLRRASGLPRPDRYFTGRKAELRQITAAMSSDGLEAVCVISGMPGVGKTTLATRAADLLADRYPDGCLFLDLRGHSPEQRPLEPAEALDRLLRRLGVEGDVIPAETDERAAMFRALLAQRRLLLLLDNASGVAQLRLLLPGSSGCGVIVTSRLRLAALDDAVPIELSILPTVEAVALFRSVVGKARLAAEPGSADMIKTVVRRCGRLPLAVRIIAARYRARRLWTLADLAADLASIADLDDGERSLAGSLALSLADLPAGPRRTFGLLALGFGTDIDVRAAAALTGDSMIVTARHLDSLTERNLLLEHSRGRYRLHDLVAAFARQTCVGEMPAVDQTAALHRLLDYYLRAADLADALVIPHRNRITLELTDSTAALPPLRGYDDALAWLNMEQANLTEACLAAGAAGMDAACWQLACTLRGFYFLSKRWDQWHATHTAALASALRCGDARAEAITLNNLGLAEWEQGRFDSADDHYARALRLFREADDVAWEHTVRANQAWILFARRQYAEFLTEQRAVLAFYRRIGLDHYGAITLRGIGLAETRLGRYGEAIAHLQAALDVVRGIEARLDITMTLNALGEAYHGFGDLKQAEMAFTEALAASERSGSAYERARAHHRLGDLAHDADEPLKARSHWTSAVTGYRRLGAPQAAEVEAKLVG